MKKVFMFLFCLMLGIGAIAQQKIQLRSANRAECTQSDMTGLKASFSFSSLDADKIETTKGEFSELYIEGTYPNGNVGEPQLPMFTRIIAIPTGATPVVTVNSYSEKEYTLSDYGIGKIAAMQAPVRKNIDPSTVEYAYSEAAYARNSYNENPIAMVEELGTMRGITLGRIIVQPVRYNPAAGTVKVYNDIEVSVDFPGGDAVSTEQMFKSTANVAFQSVYDQIFNIDMLMGDGSKDAYTDHPDFYNTPVKMLVICYSGFKNNSALNSWLQWKLQKGYYVDIYYTDETGTTAANIKNFIKTKYNASVSAGNAYTYLIVIGDTGQVPQYMTKTVDESCASDLGYSSVNFTTSSTSNYFPDMYYSRISVENTTHLTNYMNKVLTYEKYEFADGGNYLNNVILVGGWDSSWTSSVAKPTINYGKNNYFNSSNTTYGGFENGTISATISTSSSAGYSGTNNGVYNGVNNGVCFLNYTAHGDKQEWYQPKMTAAHVATLTNTGKYFFGVGNCCLTGNFNNTSTDYSPGSAIGTNACFAETMIRVPNAGAVAYIGCSPYSYWYEDFYWAVGAHSYSSGNAPTVSGSSKGVYDVMFMDQYWNSASSLLYVGNLAVQQAVTSGYTTSNVTDGNCNNSAHYYFQFYHTFGDGSVMPYITKPETNSVTIPGAVTPGTTSITVNAVAGSYVAVTDNSSVIYGVAEANSNGVATVNFDNAIPGTGTLYVVVTRQQYQPYFGTINIVGGTQYDITITQPQHGTISAPTQAYAGTTVTLTATPDTGYCLSSWTVKDANNQPITVTNNQFTMPESNVTVTATFVQGLAVTLANVQHGTISADPLYALQGTTINLTATPATGYEFGSWSVYKTGETNTTVTVNGNSFTMPNYPVTVSATFVLGPTELTVYDGTATNQYIPMYGYYFDDYTKSECIIPASQLTAMNGCTVSAITFYPSSVSTRSWDGSEQTVFLKEVSSTSLGGNYSGTSGATTVKQALLEMPTAGEAYTITFDTPYTYEGGNLLIGIYNTTDGSYNQVYWYGTSGLTSGVSAYGYNSSNLNSVTYNAQSFLPKTTFTYMPASTEPVAITVSANPANAGTVTGAGTYEPGTTATLTATANEGYTFSNWTRNGVVMSTNATYSFNVTTAATYVANFTLNSYNITAAANPTEGGTVAIGTRNRDDLVYDFEDGVQGWTILQGTTGNSPNNWHHNTTHVSYSSGTAHDWSSFGHNSSSGFMMSESYISATSANGTAYGAVTPDNYLISPQVRLGGSISFYAGARNTSYCAEQFSVMVSTTDNTNTGSFTTVATYTLSLSEAGYTSSPYTIDLSDYSGMGYVAIRHWGCTDQWVLCVDDITIVEGEDQSSGSGNFNYGETCVVTATPNNGYRFVNWTDNSTVVSTDATYSFTVNNDRDLVANFSQQGVVSYTITATANPTAGGTITGGGIYNENGSCTLSATANTDYAFVNWTKDGVVVSTNASYTFTVTEDADYVANFNYVKEYAVKIMPNDPELGAVAFGRNRETLSYDFEDGWQGWTTFQGNTTSPHTWMHNTEYSAYDSNGNQIVPECHNSSTGMMLSESYISASTSGGSDATAVTPDNYLVSPQFRLGGSFTFYAASRMSNYPAEKFSVLVSETDNNSASAFTHTELTVTLSDNSWNEYTIDLSEYSGMGYVAIRHYDCNDQHLLYVDDVTIVEGEIPDGSLTASYVHGTSCTVVATPNEGYYFTNWTENDNVVSTNATYTFTVTADHELVANFQDSAPQIVQTSDLSAGLNWWTATVGTTLADLEAALGENGLMITNSAGKTISYDPTLGWSTNNAFTELVPGQMYKIKTSVACEIELTGEAINPEDVTITLVPGINWIGFMGSSPVALSDALSTFDATDGDMITGSGKKYAKYDSNLGWGGNLKALVPGEGYVYNSKATANTSLTYVVTNPYDGKGDGRDGDYYFPEPTPSLYANRNHVTYQVNINGVLQASEDIEVAAFINNECRGTEFLLEPYPSGLQGQYYTYLTVFGNSEDVGQYMTFKAYDHATGTEYDNCDLTLVFQGEEEYQYGGINQGYYMNFFSVSTYTYDITAYTAEGGWYLITSPLADVTAATNVENMISNVYDLYYFDQEQTLEWVNYKPGEGSTNPGFSLEPGKGYLYANSANVQLTFTGNMYNDDGQFEITNVGGNHPLAGWNLIGNPFTVGAAIGKDFYIMNPEDGRKDIILSLDDEVAPLEGIFVYTTASSETVTFATEKSKAASTRERIVLNLSHEDGVIDRVMVRMDECDALPKYMLNENHAYMSIQQNGKGYAVVNGADAEMFPMNFKADRVGTYTISANVEGAALSYLHLIDNLTGDDVDMLLENSYTFVGAPSDMVSRFVLRIKGYDSIEEIFVYQNGSDVLVNGEGTLEVYDVMGRMVGIYAINGVETIQSLPMGVYIFRMVGDGIKTQKVVVR